MQVIFYRREGISSRVLLPQLTVRVERHTYRLREVVGQIFHSGVSHSSCNVNARRHQAAATCRFRAFSRICQGLFRPMRSQRDTSSEATIGRSLQMEAFRPVSARL